MGFKCHGLFSSHFPADGWTHIGSLDLEVLAGCPCCPRGPADSSSELESLGASELRDPDISLFI